MQQSHETIPLNGYTYMFHAHGSVHFTFAVCGCTFTFCDCPLIDSFILFSDLNPNRSTPIIHHAARILDKTQETHE